MKLSTWAKKHGLKYHTAWNLFQAGKLPCPATQLKTGTILVHEQPDDLPQKVVLYSRVSSCDQKDDASRQLERLRIFAAAKGLSISEEIVEIGSGLNGKRPKLLKLLEDRSVTIIVIEHRDRLARFGVEFIEATLSASSRRLLVANEVECKDDLVRDMIEVLTSMCARLYGRRGAANRARKALEAAEKTE